MSIEGVSFLGTLLSQVLRRPNSLSLRNSWQSEIGLIAGSLVCLHPTFAGLQCNLPPRTGFRWCCDNCQRVGPLKHSFLVVFFFDGLAWCEKDSLVLLLSSEGHFRRLRAAFTDLVLFLGKSPVAKKTTKLDWCVSDHTWSQQS